MALPLHGLCLAEEKTRENSEKASHGFIKNCTMSMSRSSSLSSTPSSTNSNNGHFYKSPPEESHSVIDFKSGYDQFMHSSGPLLSFEQNEKFSSQSCFLKSGHCDDYNYPIWGDNLSPRVVLGDFTCIQSATTGYGSTTTTMKENQHGGEPFGWPSPEANAANEIQEYGAQESCYNKRPHTGESMQAFKKQCTTSAKGKPKPKSSAPSKDPQSIAAKNRRERISERLKILQDLVPNGSKVDLVTMLEKAISYVKFLQLQVKVLATDEFWPVQGGKAPEISQIKEAIDSILSSQRDSNSSSK